MSYVMGRGKGLSILSCGSRLGIGQIPNSALSPPPCFVDLTSATERIIDALWIQHNIQAVQKPYTAYLLLMLVNNLFTPYETLNKLVNNLQ